MKKYWCYTAKLIISGLFAVFLLSLACLIYDNVPITASQPAGFTNYRYVPNSRWSSMTEGFGFGRINSIGYNSLYDPKEDSEDDIIAFLGSSHTEALQVPSKDNFVSLTQEKLLKDDQPENDFYCLNLGTGAHYLNVTVSNFDEFAEAFDRIAYAVIEVHSIDYSVDELQRMLNDEYYSPYQEISPAAKLLQKIPALRTLKKQAQRAGLLDRSEQQPAQAIPLDITAYDELLDQVVAEVADIARSKGFQVIMVYHSHLRLTDGDGLFRIDKPELVNIFRDVCNRHSVCFLDVSDAFIDHYQSTYEPPYGFMNTKMVEGHLNATGHKIISDIVYQQICELTEEK